jgi:hypothetical protein
MLKLKLQQKPNSNTWYKIKINGELLDSDMFSEDTIKLQYNNLQFSTTKNTYVSISCSHEDEVFVKEITVKNARIIAGGNWLDDYLASALADGTACILKEDFSNVSRAGSVLGRGKEWIFAVGPDHSIMLWDGEGFNEIFVQDNPVAAISGTYTLPSGAVYEGDLLDNLPDGFGKLTFANGGTLDGQFLNGNFINGTKTNIDGTKEIGNFEGSGVELELVKGMIIDTENKTLIINKEKNQ